MAVGDDVLAPDRTGEAGRPGRTRLPVPVPMAVPFAAATAAGGALLAYFAFWGHRYGLDLRVYRASTDALLGGHAVYSHVFTASRLAATYPPFAFVLLSWFAWGSFATAQFLLWGLSIAAATASVVIVLRDLGHPGRRRLWLWAFAWVCVSMLAIEPARSSIDYGQIEFLLMFAVVADLLLVRPPFGGIALGIAGAVKLTPLAFVLVFATRRDWRSVCRAAASFVACGAIAWLTWPHASRTYWLHDLVHVNRIGTIGYAGNQSLYAIVHRAPFSGHGSTAVWMALSGLTVALGAFIAWRCGQTERRSFALVSVALAALLVSPVSWSHHWIWVILIPPMLVGRGRSHVGRRVRALLWGVVALAVAGPYWWISGGWGADVFDALLPAWSFVVLIAWSAAEYRTWRSPAPVGTGALAA